MNIAVKKGRWFLLSLLVVGAVFSLSLLPSLLGQHTAQSASKAPPPSAPLTFKLLNMMPYSRPLFGVRVEVHNRGPQTCILSRVTLGRGANAKNSPLKHPLVVAPGKKTIFGMLAHEKEWSHWKKGRIFASCSPKVQAVNGLRGFLKAAQYIVKPGDDILVRFHVELALPAPQDPLYVWDTKYSAGYRSWSFVIKTPQGKKVVLRRAVVRSWRKNIPHPVALRRAKPYILVGWGRQHGVDIQKENYFSLKKLGLQTSLKGTYHITGVFQQKNPTSQAKKGKRRHFWSGKLRSNTLNVTAR